MRTHYLCAVLGPLYLVSVYSAGGSGNHIACGPNDLCNCEARSTVDCSNSDVKLKDVCDYINSTSHFNVTVLCSDSVKKGIPILGQEDLQGCNKLVELYLSNNSICKIESGAFHGFERLEILDLSINSISSVTNKTFMHLPKVRYLNISACNITDIEAFGFGSMSSLENLDLSWNMRLGFQALKNIIHGLQYTKIRVANASKIHTTFGPGTRLQIDDICNLGNTSIQEVDLSRNRIEFFENNALNVLPDTLNIVRLEYNKFTFRPYLLQIGCLKNMTEFFGSFQNYAYDPSLFDNEYQGLNDRNFDNSGEPCPFLKQGYNTNDRICPFFKPGEKIEITNYVPKCPKHVRRIEFAQSGLIYAIGNMILLEPSDQLEYVDVSGNVLYSWTGPFRTFKNLKYLDMSKNYISYVNRYVFRFARKTLENLQIQNNYIGTVFKDEQNGPFIFNNLSELKTLNLSYNFISNIPANLLLDSNKVKTLDLSVNNIENWTLDVSQLDRLLHLILRNNFFQTLPEHLLNRLEENSKQIGEQFTIDLRNNTIQVDCDRKDFLQWLVKHQNNMIGFEEYNFMSNSGRSITLDDFKRAVSNLDKQCRDYTLILVLSIVFSLAVLFFIVGALIYRYRWKLRYVLRYAKIKRLGYQPARYGKDSPYVFDVFISYANENREFVTNEVYPNLTQNGFEVCLHERNFLPGRNIADNILDAIATSRHTLVILSNAYVTTSSTWCMYEFNMARMESIERNESSCLLLVLYEDVPTKKTPAEILQWIGRNTYLEYGDPLFWDNLERAVKAEQ